MSQTITTRDCVLLLELAAGKTDGEIARALHFHSAKAVAAEIEALTKKLAANNRASLVARALRGGFIY
jgi:DNA-binding NarL/FixJ family response regulator